MPPLAKFSSASPQETIGVSILQMTTTNARTAGKAWPVCVCVCACVRVCVCVYPEENIVLERATQTKHFRVVPATSQSVLTEHSKDLVHGDKASIATLPNVCARFPQPSWDVAWNLVPLPLIFQAPVRVALSISRARYDLQT